MIEPGDVLVFSGAHLHGSVPNTNDKARFNTELRTVHVPDFDRHMQQQAFELLGGCEKQLELDERQLLADGETFPPLHGAFNVDGLAPRVPMQWFKGLLDGRSLAGKQKP